MEKFSLQKLRETMSSASKPSSPAPSEGSSRPNSSSHASPAITCIALFPDAVITIDSTHSLRICSPTDAQDYNCDGAHQTTTTTTTTTTTGPTANRDAVMGISPLTTPNPFSADFFTWSAGGLVNFWDFSGKKRASQFVALGTPPHADDDANELKVVRTTPQGMEFFVAGDKYGVLSLFSGQRWTCLSSVRAHSAEITDIAIYQDTESEGCLIASCGRDRVVQLFRLGAGSSELELVQTLEEHVGSVNRVLFKNNGEKLLSCSSDRTIVVRERAVKETEKEVQVAYFSAKVITMKSSPVSMEPSPCDPDGLVVSSTDRYVHHYQVSSGRSLHSFRASDPETGDAVVMSSLSIACDTPGQNPTLLVGVCSTDKSLRVYDFDRGTLLSGEFGHTEGVTDVILLEDKSDAKNVKKTLISTGMDGIVMMWDLGFSRQSASRSASPARAGGADGTQTPKKEVVVRQPLRRVISRSEMTGFQRADGQPPMPSTPSAASTNGRDTSPARTVRPKNSRTSLKSNTYSLPSRTNTSNTLSTPTTHTPGTHRLSAASAASAHTRFDRSPSPSRRRPNTSVGVGAGDSNAARRPSMGSNIRTNSSSSSTTRLAESTPRRTTTRRMSLSASNSTGASTPSGASSTATSNSSATELSSINSSTEQMCRTLKAYRKKLSAAGTGTGLSELEAELKMTLKAVEEKAKAEKGKHGERGHGHGHLHFSKRLSSITRKGKHSHGSDDSKR
ncbi:hypothetical protein KEM56_002583 [Ascosphaera pollenicola]|nr:hypothetical protein KEM56_002583 [Ascosphaera pollenicola]